MSLIRRDWTVTRSGSSTEREKLMQPRRSDWTPRAIVWSVEQPISPGTLVLQLTSLRLDLFYSMPRLSGEGCPFTSTKIYRECRIDV